MKSNPDKITRKKFMEMDHLLSFANTESASRLSRAFRQGVDLREFPFSWHERIPGAKIEEPEYWMTIDNLKTYGPKNTIHPELKEISQILGEN